MASCSTPGATAAESISVDQHPLVRCAVIASSTKETKAGRATRGDDDGDVDDAVARPGEDFVFATTDTCDTSKLREVGSDSGRQVGGDAGEADSGDGVAGTQS
jgi:hypothetical protein